MFMIVALVVGGKIRKVSMFGLGGVAVGASERSKRNRGEEYHNPGDKRDASMDNAINEQNDPPVISVTHDSEMKTKTFPSHNR